jgi:hypothetical protein
MNLFIALQTGSIQEKIKTDPNNNYEIGLVIGSYLPFIFLNYFSLFALLQR